MIEPVESAWPFFGIPPARQPRPAATERSLHGKRVILSTPEGFVYDMRAVSRSYADPSGREVIDIVTDEDYYRWMLTGTFSESTAYPSILVWVE